MRRKRIVAAAAAVAVLAGLMQAGSTPKVEAGPPPTPDAIEQVHRAKATPAGPVIKPPLPKPPVESGTPSVVWPSTGAQLRSKSTGAAIQVVDRAKARRANIDGLLLQVPATGSRDVSVDYSKFRNAYGGDWATRLRLVAMPACVLMTPDKPQCQRGKPLATGNNHKSGVLTAVAPAGTTALAVAAAPAGPSGDYKATSLSSSGAWNVSTQTGDFAWSYPLGLPPVPGGLSPSIGLSYSTGSVDGRTVSTNNQPSWIGEGWAFWPGFIERSYKSCASDDIPLRDRTGDQCWGGDNATMSLSGGGSSELVLQDGTTNTWKPKNDDGTRIERHYDTSLNDAGAEDKGDEDGEYWVVTKPDGTKFYFGLNKLPGWTAGKDLTKSTWTTPVFGRKSGEPCNKPTFAESHCRQAYRWNLDYAVDPLGNAVSYFYQPEVGRYGLNVGKKKVDYTRGGTLLRAEYGLRSSAPLAQAPARVLFETADRCVPNADCTKKEAGSWPDVPWNLECTAAATSCGDKYSPSFWSTKRLAAVQTETLSAAGYQKVDRWSLAHSYPKPDDTSRAGLWLDSIVHAGQVGGELAMPKVSFVPFMTPNRVNRTTDGLPPMNKPRISAIDNESGGRISVDYHDLDCNPLALPKPESNSTRCFPVRWAPEQAGPVDDWFVKYAVKSVVENDLVGGAALKTTTYDYAADPGVAWAYNHNPRVEEKFRSWTEFRGYQKVSVVVGDPKQDDPDGFSQTDYLYYRGMHGDRLPNGATRTANLTDSRGATVTDEAPYAGAAREVTSRNGRNGPVLSAVITEPVKRGPTATQGQTKAYFVAPAKADTYLPLDGDRWQHRQVSRKYDDNANLTELDDRGDFDTTTDDQCTRYRYVPNPGLNMLNRASEIETVSKSCEAPAVLSNDLVSGTRTSYDGLPFGQAPTRGLPSKAEQITSFDQLVPIHTQAATARYDDFGRPTEVTDARGKVTRTAYTDEFGLNVGSKATNPLSFTMTTEVDPRRGNATRTYDANNLRTDLTYDPLGRLAKVWKPGRSKDNNDAPDISYTYEVRSDRPSSIRTETIVAGSTAKQSGYTLLDGFLRERQTQAPAFGGGAVVSDKYYDSRGQVVKTNDLLALANVTPGTTLQLTNDDDVSAQTRNRFDGTGRLLEKALWSRGQEVSKTSTAYHTDRTESTPAGGGTASTTFVNARGQVTELRQYHGTKPEGSYDKAAYAYWPDGKMRNFRDADGNVWEFSYDLRGNLVKQRDPDSGTSTFAHDEVGNTIRVTDARGKSIFSRYDALGRKLDEREGTADGALLASWSFDRWVKGQSHTSTRYAGKDAYVSQVDAVDAFGRPTQTSFTIPSTEAGLAGTYTSKAEYHVDGTPKSETKAALPGLAEETVQFSYNGLGLPSTTISPLANYVTSTGYTAFGELAQVRFDNRSANSLWQSLYYDEATRRPTRNLLEKNSLNGVVVRNSDITYDAVGNVKSVADRLGGGSASTDRQCFNYDNLRRLSEAWTAISDCLQAPTKNNLGGPAPYWQSYTYDATGNRRSWTDHGIGSAADRTTTASYPAAGSSQPHTVQSTLTSDGLRKAYKYDVSGNTTERPGPDGKPHVLTWNSEQQVESITSAGDEVGSYVYTPDGTLLVSRDANGSTLHFGGGEIHVDKAGIKTSKRFYTHAGKRFAVRTKEGLQYLFGDHLATDSLTVQSSDLKATVRRYDPYGRARGVKPTLWPDEKGFLGGVQLEESGLTRMGVRDYDPELGRFTSVDPVLRPEQPKQNNGYSFAWNNPTTLTDPSGMEPLNPDCAGDMFHECHSYFGGYKGGENINGDWGRHCKWQRQCYHGDPRGNKGSTWKAPPPIIKKNHCGAGAVLCWLLPINSFLNCVENTTQGQCDELILDLMPWGKIGKGIRYLDELSDLAKPAARHTDEVAHGGARTVDPPATGKPDPVPDIKPASTKADEATEAAAPPKSGGAPPKSGGSKPKSNGCNSFVPGTLVLMADGTTKPIEEVRVGDKVLATDPKTGKTKPQRVTATILGEGLKALVDLSVTTTGRDGNSTTSTVIATDDHPIYNRSRSIWQKAYELPVGTALAGLRQNRSALLTSATETVRQTRTHNLTVSSFHTYYVLAGTTPVLVHNSGPCREVPFGPVAKKAMDTAAYVKVHDSAPPGYRGGRSFANDGRENGMVLPRTNSAGEQITYKEWDVNPHIRGVNRGSERLVTGGGRTYYTTNHYKTFTEFGW